MYLYLISPVLFISTFFFISLPKNEQPMGAMTDVALATADLQNRLFSNKHSFINIQQLFIINHLINLEMKQLKCEQHELPFSLFCDRCNELICDRCSIIGPHNTAIHSLSQIGQAYERRVKEIKERLNKIYLQRDVLIEQIMNFNQIIEELKLRKEGITGENQKYQSKMLQKLTKKYENIQNNINKVKQDFYQQYSTINDLGHQFEQMQDEIQSIVSHQHIIKQFKQINDRTQLLLHQNMQFDSLPKQLTQIRIQLEKMESFEIMLNKKSQILKELASRLYEEKAKIKVPPIDYLSLLNQLQKAMNSINQVYVCHFCGEALTESIINQPCEKNKLTENTSICDLKHVGFCSNNPDSTKFGTHRHYFGEGRDELKGYKKAYGEKKENVHMNYIRGLILKLKTIIKIKKVNIKEIFEKGDKNKRGKCELVVFEFVLLENCGVSSRECEILSYILEDENEYNYKMLLEELDSFDI